MQTLREIIERLRNTYCRSIGVQFMHIDDLAVRNWLQERMESDARTACSSSRDEQLRILTRLTDAVIFEEFIQKKYVGRQELLARGRREPDPAARPGDREGRRRTASTRSCSAWPTAAG